MATRCRGCGVAKDGYGMLCIACYREAMAECMCTRVRFSRDDKRDMKKGKMPAVPHCRRCKGEGWVIELGRIKSTNGNLPESSH